MSELSTQKAEAERELDTIKEKHSGSNAQVSDLQTELASQKEVVKTLESDKWRLVKHNINQHSDVTLI